MGREGVDYHAEWTSAHADALQSEAANLLLVLLSVLEGVASRFFGLRPVFLDEALQLWAAALEQPTGLTADRCSRVFRP